MVIDFSNDDEHFPSLPTTRRPSSPSQTSEHSANTLTITTIQTAVAEALKMAREEHSKEIITLRNEIKSLQDTFQLMMQTIATQSETINKHIISLNPQQEDDTSISPPRKRRPPHIDKTPTKSNKQPPPTTVHTVTEGHDTKMNSRESDEEDDQESLIKWDDSDSDTDVPSTHTDASRASVGRED